MGLDELRNLAKIGQLKTEPCNMQEVKRLLSMARTRLEDASLKQMSLEGRFTSAYNASHAAALAALRWHGYRSENRFTVFQCLVHTLGWSASQWRVLDAAHQKRNLAEYEGFMDLQEALVTELMELAQKLIDDTVLMTQN
ncbi:hypothetical protein [Limnohabitans sp. T6-20]|uniref:hypothetical protein n=1 Tax=Limnohabitans sp. T6-20 TaxID=1100725 RepID=UPI000DD23961|nr:hypothetical protein [Limnohabitans sp. T6-20]PUE09747.1 hypothetical protein B9Z33_06235 [Limnohabitans sp. T6-20]